MSGEVSGEEVRDTTSTGDAARSILFDGEPSDPNLRTSKAASVTNTLPMVWVNGERVASDAMHVSALDRGFTLADGIFETMLVRYGMIFRPARHLDRLRNGARVLRIELPSYVIGDWLEEAAFRTGDALGMAAAAMRLTVSRRPGARGLAPRGWGGSTVVITGDALSEFPVSLYEQGLSALTASARRDERSLTAGVKTLAYTETIAALARARRGRRRGDLPRYRGTRLGGERQQHLHRDRRRARHAAALLRRAPRSDARGDHRARRHARRPGDGAARGAE
jgi:hypothetical protein